MAFKRIFVASQYAQGSALDSDLATLGVLVAADKAPIEANIEDTLIAASIEGLKLEDYRLLSLIADWFLVHAERVNADRLTKLVGVCERQVVKIWWTALAQTKMSDWRFKKLQNMYIGERFDLMGDATAFQIQRKGEDARFAHTVMRVSEGLLRHRPRDILPPELLAKQHRSYYFRTMMGPSYRADMWALLEREPNLSAAELARKSYGSFPTAWEVKRDAHICLGSN